jgi:hypothetical protein
MGDRITREVFLWETKNLSLPRSRVSRGLGGIVTRQRQGNDRLSCFLAGPEGYSTASLGLGRSIQAGDH